MTRETRPLDTPRLASLSWGQEFRETIRLAAPLALANLLQMLTYAIDVIFIARLGEDELAASTLAVSVFGMVLWALTALTGAVAPLIAEAIGSRARTPRPVRRATRMALWLAVISGAGGMAVCMLLIPLMRLSNQEEQLLPLANAYNSIVVFSLIPMLLASVLRNFVSALGRPIFATLITALGIVVNSTANYAFIFGNLGAPELGLAGAAIATVITSFMVLAAYVLAIVTNPVMARYRIFYRLGRPDWKRMRKIISIGTPIAFTVLAEAGIFAAAPFIMGVFGPAQVAGHALAIQLAALAFQVPFGVGQAVTIRVGYSYGAGDPVGIGRAGWAALAISTGFMSFTASMMVLFPVTLLSIYVDPDLPSNAAVLGFALQYLVLAAAFQLVDGVQAVAAGALRGLQDTRVPMWIAIFSYWVPGIGLAIGLGLYTPLQGTGVWIGLATGLAFAGAFMLWRWMARERLGLTKGSGAIG